MKYTLEERMDIGRRLYTHELTCKEAMEAVRGKILDMKEQRRQPMSKTERLGKK